MGIDPLGSLLPDAISNRFDQPLQPVGSRADDSMFIQMVAQGFEQGAGLILFFGQRAQPFLDGTLCRKGVFGPSEKSPCAFGMDAVGPGGRWLPILYPNVDSQLLTQGRMSRLWQPIYGHRGPSQPA